MPGVAFAFFGYPGAGKSTLCRRFGELTGCPSFDTDAFMTEAERRAVEEGRYTQAMRLANIERYAEHARRLLDSSPCVALADGLPNDEARSFLRQQLSEADLVFVLVQAPPELWPERLANRDENAVNIDVEQARAYVLEHWQDPAPGFGHEVVVNGDDRAAVDAALLSLYRRHVPGASTGER